MSQASFDVLPREIIKRIATFLPCRSALALSCISRKFHGIVYDRLVFRILFENGNGFSKRELRRAIGGSKDDPAELARPPHWWARMALASEKAALYVEMQDSYDVVFQDEWRERMKETIPQVLRGLGAWAPQLMLLKHPFIYNFHMEIAARFYLGGLPPTVTLYPDDLQALIFCLTLFSLQHGMSRPPSRQVDSYLDRIKTQIWHQAQIPGAEIANWKPMRQLLFVHVLLTALRERIRVLGEELILPPNVLRIPFLRFMDLPLPFSENSFSHFQKCHLRAMTSPDFLEDGTWITYYSLSLSFENMMFQPPVRDVQFSRRPEMSINPNFRAPLEVPWKDWNALSATGVDHGGPFTANGGHHEGQMEMEETNWRGQHWRWHLEMTPIGLFGTWGNRQGDIGYLWLFKKDWCGHLPIEADNTEMHNGKQ